MLGTALKFSYNKEVFGHRVAPLGGAKRIPSDLYTTFSHIRQHKFPQN
jgi:hypothetical protein